MALRILWDKYEAAILLDACIKVCNEEIKRSTAIKNVSAQLRQMAINKGIEIDDIYRNINGISLQMSMMIGLITGESTGLTAHSKLFERIIETYRNDRETFEEILSKARSIIGSPSNDKSKFFEYVMSKKPKEASQIYLALDAADKFAVDSKALTESIYADPSNKNVDILRRKVLCNKFFAVRNKKLMHFAEMGVALLGEYVNNCEEQPPALGKGNERIAEPQKAIPHEENNNLSVSAHKDNADFMNWMVSCAGLTESAARSYRSSLKLCDSFANEHGVYNGSITDLTSFDEFTERYTALKNNSEFKDYSDLKHRFPVAALNKYAQYMEAVNSGVKKTDISEKPVTVNDPSKKLADRCNKILQSEFEDGYRIGHYMHKQRFVELYEEQYDTDISNETEDIDALLKEIGQVIDDRVFANSGKTNGNVLTDIYNDIQNTFNNGATVIYLECIFEKYDHRLSEEIGVYSASTLKNVFENDRNFPMGFTTDGTAVWQSGVSGGYVYEVEKCLINSHVPLSYDDLHQILWYIPMDKIKLALNRIPNAAYVDGSSYFYAPNFNIPANELSKLTTAMNNVINNKGYLVSKDLREIFRNNCPTAAIDSEHYKDYAIRKILKVLLEDKFDFTDSVISEKGARVDMSYVFGDFAESYDKLTLSQIREFADELNTNIYWNSILEKMVRLNANEFVNKRLVNFDVTATDNVLESCCNGSFVILKDVSGYLSFPPCGYKWNGFVLESYLRDYSKTFGLVQLSVSSDDFAGAMVRISAGFESYEDVAAEVLVSSDAWNDERSALKYLVDTGLQKRKSHKNIAGIIKKVKNIIVEKNEGRKNYV